jgi:hypothetical protein
LKKEKPKKSNHGYGDIRRGYNGDGKINQLYNQLYNQLIIINQNNIIHMESSYHHKKESLELLHNHILF